MDTNPEAAERERLRREAQDGPCPVCGRIENEELERQMRDYVQANSKLHAQLQAK